MLWYRIQPFCTGSVHTGIYMLRMAMPGEDMYSVMICICMVHTRMYHVCVHTCTYVVHCMGSTCCMYRPLWYVLLCSCMNCSCVMYVQFMNNAMVQDSAFLYKQCSYRDIHAKNGYARLGHVQCHDMYIHCTYTYVQCTDMYIRCT